MENMEGKVFVGIRLLLSLFMLAFLIGIDNSRVWDAVGPQLAGSLIGLGLAIWIAVSYGRGKNWARIWMLIACYLTLFLLIRDIVSFGDFARRFSHSGFEAWINIALAVDIIGLIGTLYVLVMVHKNKEKFLASSTVTVQSPEDKLTSLKTMREKGLISQEEFETKKAEILKQM